MDPKRPNDKGWKANPKVAADVDKVANVSPANYTTEVFDKEKIRVISSYVVLPGDFPMFMVSASKGFKPPGDDVVAMIRKVFDMEKADEVVQTGRCRMLMMKATH